LNRQSRTLELPFFSVQPRISHKSFREWALLEKRLARNMVAQNVAGLKTVPVVFPWQAQYKSQYPVARLESEVSDQARSSESEATSTQSSQSTFRNISLTRSQGLVLVSFSLRTVQNAPRSAPARASFLRRARLTVQYAVHSYCGREWPDKNRLGCQRRRRWTRVEHFS